MPEQTTGPSWTPEDVERAAAAAAGVAWSSWDEYRESFPAMAAEARRIGKRVLAALAEAGRLARPDPSATGADQ